MRHTLKSENAQAVAESCKVVLITVELDGCRQISFLRDYWIHWLESIFCVFVDIYHNVLRSR